AYLQWVTTHSLLQYSSSHSELATARLGQPTRMQRLEEAGSDGEPLPSTPSPLPPPGWPITHWLFPAPGGPVPTGL
ncbi:unnamed protein product, partial [Nesidiocoris tenuis]